MAAACLEKQLDFSNFLQNTLVPEVQIQDPGYNVLRRRIAILLGQWVPVKSDELKSDPIYQIFQHLLNSQDHLNDLVVRITAGRQLKQVLDVFEFSPEIFKPYAPSIFQNLMALVQEVESSDTKMGLLNTVRMAVTRMEDNVRIPLLDIIVMQFANILQDRSFLGSNSVSTSPVVGKFRRRAFAEAGYPHTTWGVDILAQARVDEISLTYPASGPEFDRSYFGTFPLSLQ